MGESFVRITNQTVSSNESFVYIIYLNGESYGYCRNEVNAKFHIEDIADELEKELQIPNARVLRENIGDNEIHISRQRLGKLFDGAIKPKYIVSFKAVSKYFRHREIPTPPPLPVN